MTVNNKNNTTIIFEYIWLDSNDEIRSKTKIINTCSRIVEPQNWNYDGSSTGQAVCELSDVILKPVYTIIDPIRTREYNYYNVKCYLVLCELYILDENNNMIPHEMNYRYICSNIDKLTKCYEPLFGIEQEYIIKSKEDVITNDLNENTTNKHYCGVSSKFRSIVEEHMKLCIEAQISICGINAEVTESQWEYQIGKLNTLNVCDQLIISRYILNRVADSKGCYICYDAKPDVQLNGSGCHTNFSTNKMRDSYEEVVNACECLSKTHTEDIKQYGKYDENKMRLTGKHETSNIDTFTWGYANRGVSVRIPISVKIDENRYLEDRRPPANMNPYKVVSAILKSVCLCDK